MVMLAAITFGFCYNVVGVIDNRRILRSPDKARALYAQLDPRIKDIYSEATLEETRVYKLGMNTIDLLWPIQRFIFEFIVTLLNIPAFLWYGWLAVLQRRGSCESGETFSIW